MAARHQFLIFKKGEKIMNKNLVLSQSVQVDTDEPLSTNQEISGRSIRFAKQFANEMHSYWLFLTAYSLCPEVDK
jgi:hypothetical protein